MRVIETNRLIVRPFAAGDLESVIALQDACFGAAPRSMRSDWLDWTLRNYVELAKLHQPPYGDYAVQLRSSGEVIAAVGLVPSFGPFEKLREGRAIARFTTEMGLFWAVAPPHQRRGYATEAARAIASFAFDELNVARLVATTEHDNAASIAVMRKLGMRIERNPDPDPQWFQTVGVLSPFRG